MAIDLLTEKYWDGHIKRQYHHELEAFIWVLSFVFFRYHNGTAVPNTIVEEWMTSNYGTCHEKKSSFLRKLREHRHGESVQPDFKDVWPIALQLHCCEMTAYLKSTHELALSRHSTLYPVWNT